MPEMMGVCVDGRIERRPVARRDVLDMATPDNTRFRVFGPAYPETTEGETVIQYMDGQPPVILRTTE